LQHRVVVFATPVYWYAMSGILKTFFDRLTDLVTVQKYSGRKLEGKSVFVLTVGSDEKLPDGFEIPFELTSQYFDMDYKGCIYHSTQKSISQNEIEDIINLFKNKIEMP